MAGSAHLSYEDQDQDVITPRWVTLFVLLSLLAHATLILVLWLLSLHIPLPVPNSKHQTPPEVKLTLIQPPPPKTIFMPTPEQKNAPHKQQQVESDHDTQLASHSKTSRKNDTIMPDVVSKDNKSSSLQSSPSSPPVKAKDQTTTPPTPAKQETKPQQQPTQQPPQKAEPQKQDQAQKPPPPKAQPVQQQQPPPPAVDDNGLPVLPAINAPTLAPQAPASAQPQQVAAPPPVMPVIPMNVQGKAGMSGQPTPAAMKTDLGMYKARFYQAVASRWYPGVSNQMTLIGVGGVDIEYTIMPDGTITTRVLNDGGSSMMLLLTISLDSIRGCSPFIPFPPAMLKQYPNGYTDHFTFSIYGQ